MSAGSAAVRVFADADVLYGAAARDIFMDLSIGGWISLRFSDRVLEEMARARIRRGYDEKKTMRLVEAMKAATPDSLVSVPNDAPIRGLPDPDDEHVLAGALYGNCDVLVTRNLKDFPEQIIANCGTGIRVEHPDVFLVRLVTQDAEGIIGVVDRVRRSLSAPPFDKAEYCERLENAHLRGFAALMRVLLPN